MEIEKKNDSLSFKEQKEALFFIFGFSKKQLPMFLTSLLAGLLMAVLNAYMPFVLKDFMDNHLAKQNATTQILLYFTFLYFALSVVKALFWFVQWFLFEQATHRTMKDMRAAIYKKIHTLGLRYFDKTPTGWLITRITNDTNLLEFWFLFIVFTTGCFSLFSAVVALFAVDEQVAWMMLPFLPVLLLAVFLYQKFSAKTYKEMREKLSDLNTKLNEYLSGIKIIQNFAQERRIRQHFEETNEDYFTLRKRVIQMNSIFLRSFVSLITNFGMIVAVYLFCERSFHSVVAAGIIYSFTTNLQLLFNPIGDMMDFLSTFSDGIVAGHRIKTVMEETDISPKQQENEALKIQQGKVEFKNVSFSYDGEVQVLKNLSFTVNAGETVGIVGHTGSGKSSIINVLKRFYEFSDGEVFIDDHDIRSFPMKEIQERIGLILQDSALFVGDVKENIRFMHPTLTEEEIIEAAKFTQAHYFVEKLENGYNEEVFEGGSTFSQGERQLLSFARTIATNPKILILDEATANVDTETEELIQNGLKNMRENRTTIVIAHRLSTIKDANQILVLDKGELIEQGTHDELLAQNGQYAEMYRLQVQKTKNK